MLSWLRVYYWYMAGLIVNIFLVLVLIKWWKWWNRCCVVMKIDNQWRIQGRGWAEKTFFWGCPPPYLRVSGSQGLDDCPPSPYLRVSGSQGLDDCPPPCLRASGSGWLRPLPLISGFGWLPPLLLISGSQGLDGCPPPPYLKVWIHHW